MAKILVVGGAGYIGSHVSKLLSARKRTEVVVFDDLSTGFRELVQFGPLKKASLNNPNAISACLQEVRPMAVLHFANYALVGESVAEPAKYYYNNVLGTLNLLEAMRASKRKVPLIFSSSCAVYGEPQGPLSEDHAMNPVNPYGTCKKIVEEMLVDFHRAYGQPFVSLRYFNAAGADPDGQLGELHNPETHLIPRLVELFLGRQKKKDPVMIWGDDYETPDGTCIRDYVHVMDLAAAHVKALEYLEDGNKSLAVNLGSAQGYSVREIIAMVSKVAGKELRVPVGKRRAGDPAKLVAVNDRAKTVLGWQPSYGLESIVETAWNWASSR